MSDSMGTTLFILGNQPTVPNGLPAWAYLILGCTYLAAIAYVGYLFIKGFRS